MTGLAVSSFIQIGFLYIQFFIPFVAAFWLMFGGENGKALFKKNYDNTTDLSNIAQNNIDLTDVINFGTVRQPIITDSMN